MCENVSINEFEGNPLLCMAKEGRYCWWANQLSTVIGYADSCQVANRIKSDWAENFVEGEDFIVLRGEELNEHKRIVEVLPYYSNIWKEMTSEAILLYEQAVDKVCMLSKKPAAKRLHRFLQQEVLPRITRDDVEEKPREVEDSDDVIIDSGALEGIESLEASDEEKAKFRYEIGLTIIDVFKQNSQIHESIIGALERYFVEDTNDRSPASNLQTTIGKTYTPDTIAERHGVTRGRIEAIITELGIRYDPKYCLVRIEKMKSSHMLVVKCLYYANALKLIEGQFSKANTRSSIPHPVA